MTAFPGRRVEEVLAICFDSILRMQAIYTRFKYRDLLDFISTKFVKMMSKIDLNGHQSVIF